MADARGYDELDQYVAYSAVQRVHQPLPTITTTPPPASSPSTPRNRTPLLQVYSSHPPSSPAELHRRYNSSILSSPTPSEAQDTHAVVSKALKQDLAAKFPDPLDEEVELNEVAPNSPPPGLPDTGKTLEDSPFHNSQALVVNQKDWYPVSGLKRNSQWSSGGPSPFIEDEEVKMHPVVSEPTEQDGDAYTPPRGSIRLLFRNCTAQDVVSRIIPPVILAAVASLVPMYMTILIGDAFGAFSYFPLDYRQATPEQRQALMKDISHSCMILTLVGLAGWVVNCVMIGLWVRVGELVAHRLRAAVFASVMDRNMEWFDLGMGLKVEELSEKKESSGEDAEENVGAGGLMSKFTRYVYDQPKCDL